MRYNNSEQFWGSKNQKVFFVLSSFSFYWLSFGLNSSKKFWKKINVKNFQVVWIELSIYWN